MGLLRGITGIVVSPISVVKNTIDRFDKDGVEAKDVFTLGLSKVVDGVKDTAQEIEDDFEN